MFVEVIQIILRKANIGVTEHIVEQGYQVQVGVGVVVEQRRVVRAESSLGNRQHRAQPAQFE
eukprot:2099229-Rhodomonas_salina.2